MSSLSWSPTRLATLGACVDSCESTQLGSLFEEEATSARDPEAAAWRRRGQEVERRRATIGEDRDLALCHSSASPHPSEPTFERGRTLAMGGRMSR